MLQICGGPGTGKTKLLLEKAKQDNAYVVCKEPIELREQAYLYGITGIDFISYEQFIEFEDRNRPFYIYDLHEFLKDFNYRIEGYRAQWK